MLLHAYGGDARLWLDGLPMAVVRAAIRMLPRVQAEDSLRTSQMVAVGSGTLSRDARQQVLSAWLSVVRGDRPAERLSPEGMVNAGIGYRRVPKRKDAAPHA